MILDNYKKLEEYYNAFASGEINLLIIKSRGGLAKSSTARRVLKEKNVVFFAGHATPLSIYTTLYKKPNALVVADDTDQLLHSKINIALLKQLCEIEEDKKVRYSSTGSVGGKKIPKEFTSNNKILLLCNDFKRLNKDLKALLTRGIFIDFKPSDDEILNKLKNFNDLDKEIFDYLDEHKAEIEDLNFRTYLKAEELKAAKIDFKEYLKSEYSLSIEKELLLEIKDLPTDERDKAWVEATGKSIRTLRRRLTEGQRTARTDNVKEDKK